MQQTKKILICPLHWGLGHATRDIPIILELQKAGFEIIVGADSEICNFIKANITGLTYHEIRGYKVRYSKFNTQILRMFFLIPSIIFWTVKEHYLLKKIIANQKVDVVISDHRFGLWNNKTYNIFITHQLKVKFPGFLKFLEPCYQMVSDFIIGKYDECWIPDYKDSNNLAGVLSHQKSKLKNLKYIGPISRFNSLDIKSQAKSIDVLFLLSGPEPQRNILEEIIYKQTKKTNLNLMLIRGTNQPSKYSFSFPIMNLVNKKQLQDYIAISKLVICRAGYSSIMDLVELRQRAVLVPTPGQTEQEYLARHLAEKGYFYSMPQNEFRLETAIQKASDYPADLSSENKLLRCQVEKLKEKKNKQVNN